MRNIRSIAIAIVLATASLNALAEFNVGVSYVRADFGFVELDTVQVNAGYGFNVAPGFVLIPEVRAGTSAGSDRVSFVDVKMKDTFGGGLRAEYNFPSGFMVFGGPSYSRYNIEVRSPQLGKDSSSSWEWGIGAGVGYNFVKSFGVEVFYENVDSEDFYGAGLRFRF